MRILLAKCRRSSASHFGENSGSLALGYLAAALREAGFSEVEVLDGALTRLTMEEMAGEIAQGGYGLVGFTIADVTYFESTFACVAALRRRGLDALIVLGGYAPTFQYADTLRTCQGIDAVVRFEGERTLVELARCIRDERDWREVKGIAYRENESTRTNPLQPPVEDLDQLPFPARDTLPYILEHLPETGVVSMAGSRGCYGNCSFCSIRAFHAAHGGPAMRLRSVENIADEVERLVSRYGLREILFVDDVFVVPGAKGIRRIEGLISEFERRGLRVMLSISERPANVTKEVFGPLRQLGVRQILAGIEAGSDELLDYYNKNTTSGQNRRAIEVLHALEIDPTVSFINFSPATTLAQLRQNLRFLLSLRVNFLQGLLNRFQVYPETPLGQEMLRKGEVRERFPRYEYDADDPRTDLVHQIAAQSMGLFLAAAFDLKRIERRLRHRLFAAELDRSCLGLVREARSQFKNLEQSIMVDAAKVFETVLDFAEAERPPPPSKVGAFAVATRQAVRERFAVWHRKLAFFDSCCPCLTPAREREVTVVQGMGG